MKFTWKHFFELTKKVLETSNSTIALYLGVNKSTISRLYNGKTLIFSLRDNEIYKRLFDLANTKSLAYELNKDKTQEEIEDTLLDTFRQIIEQMHGTGLLKEIASDKYNDYVMELIKLARANSSNPSGKTKNNLHDKNNTTIATPKNISPDFKENTSQNNNINSIPAEYRKCLYCEYFELARAKHNNAANVRGTCTLHNQVMDSTGIICDHFFPNKNQITQKILIGELPFLDNFHL